MKALKTVLTLSIFLNFISASAQSSKLPDYDWSRRGGSSHGHSSHCGKALDDFYKWYRNLDLKGKEFDLPFIRSEGNFITGNSTKVMGNKTRVLLEKTRRKYPHINTGYSFNIPDVPSITRVDIEGEQLEIHRNGSCVKMVHIKKEQGRGELACGLSLSKDLVFKLVKKGDGNLHIRRPFHISSQDFFLRGSIPRIAKLKKSLKKSGIQSSKKLRKRNFLACVKAGTVSGEDLYAHLDTIFGSPKPNSNKSEERTKVVGISRR